MPESTTTLGYLAAATTRASIGALIHGVGLRNIALLGKALATTDVLSGGRAWCGLGLGWYEAEQRAYGIAFDSVAHRHAQLEDTLQLLSLLWGKGAPPFAGRTIDVPEAMDYPRPLSGTIPTLVGGSGPRRTLRVAARYADACNLFGQPEEVAAEVAALRAHCADTGRDPAAVEITHLSSALVGRDSNEVSAEVAKRAPSGRRRAGWAARTNPGTVDDHVLRARAFRSIGVHHLIVNRPGIWDGPAIDRFGQVISAFR